MKQFLMSAALLLFIGDAIRYDQKWAPENRPDLEWVVEDAHNNVSQSKTENLGRGIHPEKGEKAWQHQKESDLSE